jgi:hypothetical protein
VGELTFDAEAEAMRFSLIGTEGGSGDYLLLGDGRLFGLSDGYPDPESCKLLTRTDLTIPPQNWTGDAGLCVGEASVSGHNISWWKTRIQEKSSEPAGANWFWFDADDTSILVRTMFQRPNTDYGIVGQFSFNYFTAFAPVVDTGLGELAIFCEQWETPTDPTFDPGSVADLLAPDSIPADQHTKLMADWVPGLSVGDNTLPPPWPDQVAATALMVSVNYCLAPFPTRVFYDWSEGSQNTTMF